MLEGDVITRVDSLVVTGDMKIDTVSNALRGIPGTTVHVTYARPSVPEPIKLSFKRAIVHVPAVAYTAVLGDHVGYIPLQTFNENTADEVTAATEKLVQQGAKGLVLDLRENGGGIVEQSLAVSSLFLKDGQPIVSVRGRNTPEEIARASSAHLDAQLPLVILTDGGTASASEIVAGALQDHDRALVLGTTSFGKGLVQSVFPLDGGYALKITTGKWYTPSGRSIHRERKLLADGRLVETRPDSLETEVQKKARPTFKSDAGRTVYGGGGITPDLIVSDDTLSSPEQDFIRFVVAPKTQAWFTTLNQYAFELRGRAQTAGPRARPPCSAPRAWRCGRKGPWAARGSSALASGEFAVHRIVAECAARRGAHHCDDLAAEVVAISPAVPSPGCGAIHAWSTSVRRR